MAEVLHHMCVKGSGGIGVGCGEACGAWRWNACM